MVRSHTLLTAREVGRVNRAVAGAHSRTGATVVPIVISQSSQYPRSEDTVGVITGLLALAAFYGFYHHTPQGRAWSVYQEMRLWGMLSIIGATVMGFVMGTLLTAHSRWVRRWFVSPRKMRTTVQDRARAAYNDTFMHTPPEQREQLVVLFLSLFERRVEIAAGVETTARLRRGDLDSIRRPILWGLRTDKLAQGLVRAVARTAKILAATDAPELERAAV